MSKPPSTTAYRVVAAFNKLAEKNEGQADTNMLGAWLRAFPDVSGGPRSVEIVGHLSRSVRLLQLQLRESTTLPEGAKPSTLNIVDGLALAVSTEALASSYGNIRSKFHPSHLGALTAAGYALSVDFPEVEIADDAANALTAEVRDLLVDLMSLGFDANFKSFMANYLNDLMWALENRLEFGSAPIKEASASVILTACETASRERTAPTSEHREDRLNFLRKATKTAVDAGRALFVADVLSHGLIDFARDVAPLLFPPAI